MTKRRSLFRPRNYVSGNLKVELHEPNMGHYVLYITHAAYPRAYRHTFSNQDSAIAVFNFVTANDDLALYLLSYINGR